LRELLIIDRLPESWIPPDHILDLRARVRLRHTLSHQRGEWQQRIQAVLYHHGCPQRRNLMSAEGRSWLAAQPLPSAALEQVAVAVGVIDALDRQLAPLNKELRSYARRQVGCKALMGQFGVGELTAVPILAELGDARRFSSSRDAVRDAGLDITVYQSDQRRAPGRLSRQGPPALRWALFEATMTASRIGSPDREYYVQAAERLGSNRARLSVARKLLKRSYHLLRELGEEALAPARGRWRAPSSLSPRCAAAGSPPAPAATSAWTALIDRAAATLPPAGSPHQPSCRRPGDAPGRAPR
jgi:transposase